MVKFKIVRDDGEILELISPWHIYNLEGLDYPDVVTETKAFAFDDGSYFTKSQAEKRVISFRAKHLIRDKDYILHDKVANFIHHLAIYKLYIEINGKDCYIEGKVTDFEMDGKVFANGKISFYVEFTSVNPFLQSISDFGRNLNEVENKIHYPRHYIENEKKPYSVRVFGEGAKIINNSPMKTGFLADVTFAENTNFFELKNQLMEKISINRNFVAGDILRIDTRNKVARLNGTKFYKGISNNSQFFQLQPGENTLSFSSAIGDSTLNIDIYFRSQRMVF
ncbi:MAG: phage tail family protein [Clostridiales bacterium]